MVNIEFPLKFYICRTSRQSENHQASKTTQMLVNDFELYKMFALAVQESHIKRYGIMKLTSNTGKTYILYYSGSENKLENGVGIILSSNGNAEFDPIYERICKVRIKVNNNLKVDILSVYAPTLNRSEKNHEIR